MKKYKIELGYINNDGDDIWDAWVKEKFETVEEAEKVLLPGVTKDVDGVYFKNDENNERHLIARIIEVKG